MKSDGGAPADHRAPAAAGSWSISVTIACHARCGDQAVGGLGAHGDLVGHRSIPAASVARDWYDLFITNGAGPAPPPEAEREQRRGFFRRLRENMRKTREALQAEVQATLFEGDLDEETWERLEEALIYADVGARTTAQVVEQLEREAEDGELDRRRGADRAAVELLADARQHRRRPHRPAPRADGDPRRRRQRHRQDDDDRQARLAPEPGARQDAS